MGRADRSLRREPSRAPVGELSADHRGHAGKPRGHERAFRSRGGRRSADQVDRAVAGTLPGNRAFMTRTTLYDQGSWSCSDRVSPVEEPLSAAQFLNLLQEIEGHLTGWPVWLVLGRQEMRPHLGDGGVIECSLHETSERDFWRADPRGQMYLIRCLQEDTRE